MWIGVGETHEGRTFPKGPAMVVELDNYPDYPLLDFLNTGGQPCVNHTRS